ncbi:MAG: hypothetical protein ACYCX3_06700 [Thermoleophilia bacterium]
MKPLTQHKNYIEELGAYFVALSNALSIYLRPYAGRLGPEWLGVDRETKTTVLYETGDGTVVRLIGRWLGKPLKINRHESFEDLMHAEMEEALPAQTRTCTASATLKSLGGPPVVRMSVTKNRIHFGLGGPGARMLTLCPTIVVNSREEGSSDYGGASVLGGRETRLFSNWILQFAAFRYDDVSTILDGLDVDPVLQAHAVAEIILSSSGVRTEPARERYRRASLALEAAMGVDSFANEEALHRVVEEYPFILHDDYVDFLSKPRLRYTERLEEDGGAQSSKDHDVVPDFIYHLHDRKSLIVEIEAATKVVLKETTETGYRLPSAQGTAVSFQIGNYRRLFRSHGQQILEQLGKPDAWDFEFLLVVGEDASPDKDWHNLRNSLEGVSLRSWGFYADRLRRLQAASSLQ